jgi:hypothetical protein
MLPIEAPMEKSNIEALVASLTGGMATEQRVTDEPCTIRP